MVKEKLAKKRQKGIIYDKILEDIGLQLQKFHARKLANSILKLVDDKVQDSFAGQESHHIMQKDLPSTPELSTDLPAKTPLPIFPAQKHLPPLSTGKLY
ncbi:9576_t:CDS:2 [Paraglomus occultum]|uniref:9576_t:CDS:1 n=1 Tax=Paraglomus occultum TaxID=144539 RepID=A0A9N9BQ04_9GLOM|nr:9576_t:CDS:2 [Paraglomus occultum]